jgi:signal transduction histidine kinase
VRGFIQRSGINVELVIENDIGRLPTEVETALFRVVQESLTNIHRHSACRKAVISLTKRQDAVVVTITDDGHGFSLPPTVEEENSMLLPGVGIEGMRQRLMQLGGQLEIESGSQGTRVHAEVPVIEGRRVAHFNR